MEREKLKKDLHSVLVTFKNGATAQDFARAYLDCLGRPLELAKWGYQTVDGLMSGFPDLVERYTTPGGLHVYKAKTHAATRSLQALIANQKDSGKSKAKFGVLVPLQNRRVLMSGPPRTPTMSPAAKISKNVDKPPAPRPPPAKPPVKNPAGNPSRDLPSNKNIAHEKEGAPIIKQTVTTTSFLAVSRSSTSSQIVSTYQKPDVKANVPAAVRPAPFIWNSTSFPGRVAPAYLGCPGRHQWSDAPALHAQSAEPLQPQKISAIGTAAEESRTLMTSSNQAPQKSNVVPLTNSSSINRTTSSTAPTTQQATEARRHALPNGGERCADDAAKGKEACRSSSAVTSSLPDKSAQKVELADPTFGGRHLNVISAGNANGVLNGYSSCGLEEESGSLVALNGFVSHEDARHGDTVEEPEVENGVNVRIARILECNLITFIRNDGAIKTTFKELFEQMSKAYDDEKKAPLETAPKLGDYVALQCERHWLRAVVCGLSGSKDALVFYVDVGEFQEVAFTKLRPLLPRFTDPPQMAFVGELVGVEKYLWSGHVHSLASWLEKKTSSGRLKAVAPDSRWAAALGAKPVSVHLYMREDGTDVHLNPLVADKCKELINANDVKVSILSRLLDVVTDMGH